MPILNDLKEIPPLGIGHRREAEIVNHQDMGFGQLADGFPVTSVSPGKRHLIGERWRSEVKRPVPFPTGLVGKSAGQEGFPCPGGAGDDYIVATPDPIT